MHTEKEKEIIRWHWYEYGWGSAHKKEMGTSERWLFFQEAPYVHQNISSYFICDVSCFL